MKNIPWNILHDYYFHSYFFSLTELSRLSILQLGLFLLHGNCHRDASSVFGIRKVLSSLDFRADWLGERTNLPAPSDMGIELLCI